MLDFLVNVLRTLPLVFALVTVAGIRTRRDRRVAQLPVAVFAAIYVLVALIVVYRFNGVVFGALNAVSDFVPIGQFSRGSVYYYFLENVLLITLFIVLKAVVVAISLRVFAGRAESIAPSLETVYEFDAEQNVWFLSRHLGNLRKYLRSFYFASFAMMVLLLALVLTFPDWPGFSGVALPALAVLVIGEYFFALNGITRQEYARQLSGERDDSLRVTNFNPLRKVLRETFPDRVLTDDIHLASRASLDSGFLVGQLRLSENEIDQMAGTYFHQLRQSGEDIDVNLLSCSVDLMNHRSVLINNPFYLDLTAYLSLPAYFTLLQSRKVLVVAGRDSLVGDLREWIREGLEDVTGIPDLWNIERLSELGHPNLHVGILPFAHVHDVSLLQANAEFLADVDFVILAEPSRMLATGQMGLSMLLSRCGRDERPVYVAFDGNHDGLVDSLSHLLKCSFTEVVASSLPLGASAEAVWKTEGDHMHLEILPRVSRYLGVGTEIGSVALKYQVQRFHWVGGDAFPVIDMRWIAEQYYAQINAFADLELSQEVLHESFDAIANPWNVPQADNYFLVVEDEAANVFETIRRYSTRARLSGFVNLLSEDYLLRDYMIGNRGLFSADPKAIPSIVPDFARTERNLALRLLMMMSWAPVTESELEHEFELIGQSIPAAPEANPHELVQDRTPPVVALLEALIAKYTDASGVNVRRLSRIDGSDGRPLQDPQYRIQASTDLERVIGSLRPAYFYVEDERGEVNRIGSLLFDHVYQAILPGQFTTYGGKYYEVQSITNDDSRSGVVLRRAADHIRDRRTYRQWRSFNIEAVVDQEAVGSRTERQTATYRRAVATIEINSYGYFELDSRADIQAARSIRVQGIPTRRYKNKTLLEIELPDVPPSVRKTIALLLNELFVTLYPNAHPYVIALTSDDESDFGQLLPALAGDISPTAIYLVEDSLVDLGLIGSVERNWDRFMEIIADYLDWYQTPPPAPAAVEVEPQPAFELVFPEVASTKKRFDWLRRIFGFLPWVGKEDVATGTSQASDATEVPESPLEVEFVDDSPSESDPGEAPGTESKESLDLEENDPEHSETSPDLASDESDEDAPPDPGQDAQASPGGRGKDGDASGEIHD